MFIFNKLKTIPISKLIHPYAALYVDDYADMTNDAGDLVLYSDFVEHEYIRMLLAKLLDKKGDSVSNIELSFLADEVLRIKKSLVHNHLSLEKITELYFDNIRRSNAEITKIINKFDFYGHKNF